MKILMYAPIFPPVVGGPSTQGYHLCRALLRRGETPVVVTIGTRFGCSSPDGYRVYRYPWRYTYTPFDRVIRWIVFPLYFWRILGREKPDIVHCNNVATLSFVAGWLARKRRIPAVIKYGGEWVWETLSNFGLCTADFDELYRQSALARFLWRVERRELSRFDRIWVPSAFRARGVERILDNRRTVRIIHNSLDLPEGGFHALGNDDPFVVVSASRFVPHKRIPLIVRSFAALRDPKARLVLIGVGEEMEKAEEATRSLGVASQVTFTNRLFGEALYEEFRKASVYVSASLEEGLPNVFVEAMHFGLPIISSDVGGCREIVEHGVNGLLFDPFDEDALAVCLRRLSADRSLRNVMAEKSFEMSAKYDLSVTLNDFLEMYREAAEHFSQSKP